jgi:RNA polymerase sigma factor (sigma-70 family)
VLLGLEQLRSRAGVRVRDLQRRIPRLQLVQGKRRTLAGLPEKERAAVVLRDLEGLPTAEVAKILRSSEATVRSQICRARLKLKKARDAYRGGNR